MITTFQMYFLVMMDNFSTALFILCFISGMTTVLMTILCVSIIVENGIEAIQKAAKILWIFFASLLLISFFGATLMPTTKQMAAIYVLPKVINNKQVQKIPDKLLSLSNKWLDKQIKDINAAESKG